MWLQFLKVTQENTGAAEDCRSCKDLKREVTRLKCKFTLLTNRMTSNQEKWVEMFRELQQQRQLSMVNTGKIIFTSVERY